MSSIQAGEIADTQAELAAVSPPRPAAVSAARTGPSETPFFAAILAPDGALEEQSQQALEAELVAQGDWATLSQLYQFGAERAREAEVGRDLLLSAAILEAERLDNPKLAERLLRRVLASEPNHAGAWDGYARLCIDQGRFSEAAEFLERAIEGAEPRTQVELCLALAEIASRKLAEPARAVDALRFAVELAPERPEIRRRAIALLVESARFEDAKVLLDTDPSGESDRAAGYRLLGDALLATPIHHALAEACLEAARALGDNDALSRLDELADLRKNWEARARSLADQAQASRNKTQAAELYVRVAELHWAFGHNLLKSEEHLTRAFILCPGFESALRFLERAYRDDPGGLAAKLERISAEIKDAQAKRPLYERIARLRLAAGDRPGALQTWTDVRALEPSHHEAVSVSSALLAEAGRHDEQVTALEAFLAATSEERLRIDTHLELGRVYAEMLGDIQRAKKHFEAALKADPGNFEAASVLFALLSDLGDTRGLPPVLRVLIDHAPDRRTRLELLESLLHVAQSENPEAAFAAARQIFLLDPVQAPALVPDLERWAQTLGHSETLAQLFYVSAQRSAGKPQAEAFAQAGRAFESAGRPKEAIEAYKQALERDSDAAEARDALERLLRERNDPSALSVVLESQIGRLSGPEAEAQLLTKLGVLYCEALDEPEKAARVYQKLLELEPKNLNALDRLVEIYRQTGALGRLLEVLERRAEFARTEAERAEYQKQRAAVLVERGDGAAAATLYLAALDVLGPDDDTLLDGLYQLVRADVAADRIAPILEPLLGQRGQRERQVDLIEARMRHEPERRAELAVRGARILVQELGDPDRGLTLGAAALAARPGDAATLAWLVEVAVDSGRFDQLAATLETLLPESSGEVASRLGVALGDIYELQLDRREEAISAYRRALDADSGNAQAIAALERLLGADERFQELADVLATRIAHAADPAARIHLLVRLSALREERLGDAEGAISALEDALRLEPKDTTALSRLLEIFERQGLFRDLIAALEKSRAQTTDSAVHAALDLRSGEIYRTKLDAPREALAAYRRVLGQRPEDAGAVAGLSALLAGEAVQAEAGQILAPYYRRHDQKSGLVLALRAQLGGRDERALILEIAELELDALAHPEAAFALLARGVQQGAIGIDDRALLVRAGLMAGEGAQLAELLEAAARANPPDVDGLRALARIYEDQLADMGRAIAVCERILERVPRDEAALAALERLHGAGDDPEALARVLEERAEVTDDLETKLGFLKRAASIYDELASQPQAAVRVLLRARAAAPRERSVLRELARLYRAVGERSQAADLLAEEVRLIDDPKEAASAYVRLAAERRALDQTGPQIEALAEVLRLLPEEQEAQAELEQHLGSRHRRQAALALEPVYRRIAQWAALADVYEILLETSEADDERLERLVAIRSIEEERLADPGRAFSSAARAYRLAPDDTEVQTALERLARKTGAERRFLSLLEETIDDLGSEHAGRASLLRRKALFLEATEGERSAALDAWRALLAEVPGDLSALESLVRLGTELGEIPTVVNALESAAALLEDPRAKVDHLKAAARLSETRSEGRRKATALYQEVLALAPGDPDALIRLDTLFTADRAYDALARVLAERLAQAPVGVERAALLLRFGRIATERLDEHVAAIAAFEELVEQRAYGNDAALTEACEALDRLTDGLVEVELAARAARAVESEHRRKKNYGRVVACMERRLAEVEDAKARKGLRLEQAEVYEQRLKQPEMAFLALTRAYAELPGDPELTALLERLAGPADAYEELAELYADRMNAIADPRIVLSLSRRTAELFDRTLGRQESAVPHYEQVLSQNPEDEPSILALERIHRASGDAQGLVDTLKAKLRLPSIGDDDRRRISAEIANVLETELHDVDAALAAHRARLELAPNDVEAVRAIMELAEREKRYEELVEGLEKMIALIEDPGRRATLLVRLGGIHKEQLADPRSAVDAYARALAGLSTHAGAIAQLAQIMREPGGARLEAAQALERVYLQNSAYTEYVGCLAVRLEVALEPEERRPLYLAEVDAYETKLRKPEIAFHTACRALHEFPGDEEFGARVERLAKASGAFEDLVAFYLDELDLLSNPELSLALRRRVAALLETELKDPERAIAEHLRILDVSPGDSEALAALERLYQGSGNYGALAEIYRRRIAQAEDDGPRVRLMRELARVQAKHQGDTAGAIATLRRVLEIDEDLEALQGLAELLDHEGRQVELADVLVRVIQRAAEMEEPALLERFWLGRLRLEALDDLPGAIEVFEGILEADPALPELREYLKDRLGDAVAEEETQLAREVARLLAGALEQTEDWQGLLEVLRLELAVVPDDRSRIELLEKIAQVYLHQLKQPELAFASLTQIFREAPDRYDIRETLEVLSEELLMVEELAEVFEAALPRLSGNPALELERRIARLYDEKIGDTARAEKAYERVLSHRPMDPDATLALDRLYQKLGRWSALTDILDKRAELAEDDPALRRELLFRLAEVWEERLGEPAEALISYEEALALGPTDLPTLRAVARLWPNEREPAGLITVFEALLEQKIDNEERVKILTRLSALYALDPEQHDRAVECLEAILKQDRNHREAARQLEKLYDDLGRWEALALHLERQLAIAKDETETTRLQRQLGLIKGTKLGNIDEAVRSWGEILRKNPTDLEALDAMRKIYRAGARYEDLVTILRKLIPLQADAQGVKAIRFELAETYLDHLSRRAEAVEAAKRVLDVEPHSVPELFRLEELFLRAEAFKDAVKVMTGRIEATEDAGERVDVLFRIAEISEEKLKKPQPNAYARILQIEPSNVRAYQALADHYRASGDFNALVQLRNQRLDFAEDPAERRAILFEVVELQEKRLGHKDLGFTTACRAFVENAEDEEAQHLAERLAKETESYEILADIYEEQLDEVSYPRALSLRRRLAEIYADDLKEFDRAEHHLDRVLSQEPDDRKTRARLMHLFEGAGRHAEWVGLKLELIDQLESVTEKVVGLTAIAEVEEQRLGDLEAAILTARRILALAPDERPALDRLIRLLRESAQYVALVEVLAKKRDQVETPDQRAALQLEIAKIWETSIQDVEEALSAYRAVLGFKPAHDEALSALDRLLSGEGRFTELVEIYERQVRSVTSDREAIQLITRLADLREHKFDDREAAAETLERVFGYDAQHLPTVEALTRLYRSTEDGESLVRVLEKHLEIARDREVRVDLFLSLGEVLCGKLNDLIAAENAYQGALKLDPNCREALHGLGELYERAERWSSALGMLEKESILVGSAPAAVELHVRVGRIQSEELGDTTMAKLAFEQALDLEPTCLPALAALAAIHRESEDWETVLALESREAEHTREPELQALRYQKAAETALDRLERTPEATRLFERSIAAKHDHLPSVRALADLYFGAEEWQRTEQLLELLVDRLEADEKEERCRQYYRLAYIAEKLGDDGRALRRYLESYDLDRSYLPTLEGLAAALLRAQRWDEAQNIFQAILVHHRESLTDAEVVDLYFQLGELAMRLGDLEKARRNFDRALDLDTNHTSTLRAYARLSEKLGEWEEAYDHRARLIDLINGDERFDELLLQAELSRGPIKDRYRSIDAFAEARRSRPDEPRVLDGLKALYRETGQYPRCAEVIQDLVRVTTDPVLVRDLYLELGQLFATDLHDVTRAVDALNAALDLDRTHVKAFEEIERHLAAEGRWTDLEANYRRMLERLPKESNQKMARVVLWKTLAELYRVKLKDQASAATAYQVVLKLKPDEYEVALTLARMQSQRRESAAEAIQLYHEIFAATDSPVVIKELYPLYLALENLDRGMCALGALMLVNGADETEIEGYRRLLKKAPQRVQRPFTDALWKSRLLHPYCRNSLGELLGLLYRAVPQFFEDAQRGLMLKSKERVDLSAKGRSARSELRYFSIWREIVAAMHVEDIDHYHRAGATTSPRLYPGPKGVLFAGEQHEAFREMPSRQIAWILARQMACLRPELAPARALIPEEVVAALEGAISLYSANGSGVDHGVDKKLVEAWTRNLHKALSERALKAIRGPIQEIVQKGEMKLVPQYLEGVEHTASRVALLIAGDVRVADRGLAEPDAIVMLSHRRRLKELRQFVLSEDNFALREYLGIAIPANRSASAD